MLQIYKISKASSGGGRLCLDPPEGKILWRQNNSFAPLSHSLPLTTCQSHKSQVLLPSCSFLGTIFMVAVGQAALLPWCQPTQLLGESAGCAEPEQGAQPALRQSRACRTACLPGLPAAAPGPVPPASAQRGCRPSALALAQGLPASRVPCWPSAPGTAASLFPKTRKAGARHTMPASSPCTGCAQLTQEPRAPNHSCPRKQHPSPAPAPSCSSQNRLPSSQPLNSTKCLRNTVGSVCNTPSVGNMTPKVFAKERH